MESESCMLRRIVEQFVNVMDIGDKVRMLEIARKLEDSDV